jgi:hypothetical protein
MKTIIALLIAALFCGCNKTSAPVMASTAKQKTQWDYKIITVENFAHALHESAMQEQQTNTILGGRHLLYADNNGGDFDFNTDGKTGADFFQLGEDGWELVAAIPQTETVQSMNDVGVPQANIRTGKIILIFKRPK